MRTSSFIAMSCTLAMACPKQELAPLDPCTVSAVSTRVDQGGVSKVDLLFMVDNSGSMANKQVKLTKLLPRLVNVLTSGDRYWGQTPPAGISDKQRYFTAVTSLNLAVVDSSMGGLPDDGLPNGVTPALENCLGLGDDGVFQTSTDVAVQGINAAFNNEFPGLKKGDLVLPPDPSCAGIDTPPPYQTYDATQDHPTADELSASFGCVARVGVRGCPFEQSLEAAWKAIAPSDGKGSLFSFLDGSKGHGGDHGDQSGFVRDDAILAIMEVTDEEDCSITQAGTLLNAYSDEATERFGPASNLNMRCYSEQPERDGLVWPPERYVQAFKSLKPDNQDRVIFAAIVGIPLDASEQSYDDILARPEMQYAVSKSDPGFPTPSCANPSVATEVAYPPRRLVTVAQGFGDNAVVDSICAEDYAPALDKLIAKIASKLHGNCLPRQLTPDDYGLVQCEVFELLPADQTKCVAARGHVGSPVERTLDGNEQRLACRMNQVAVQGGATQDGVGWYYDDFSSDLKDDCNPGEQQRIAFSFGTLPSGASAVIDCLQPIPSPQIACSTNPDCPPGWVCGGNVCQLPTCPEAPSVEQEQDGGLTTP